MNKLKLQSIKYWMIIVMCLVLDAMTVMFCVNGDIDIMSAFPVSIVVLTSACIGICAQLLIDINKNK